MHFGENDSADALTMRMMVNMIISDGPNLVVITGDICSCSFRSTEATVFGSAYAKLRNVFDILERNSKGTPFVWVPGASDFESFDGTYEYFKDYAEKNKWDMTQYNTFKWEQKKLFHPFTFDLKIPTMDSSDTALRIYMFGTGRFDCLGMGGNDCIRRDAIEWFRQESKNIPEDNIYRQNGIAFMHYPLHEHMQMVDSLPVHGQRRDYTGC